MVDPNSSMQLHAFIASCPSSLENKLVKHEWDRADFTFLPYSRKLNLAADSTTEKNGSLSGKQQFYIAYYRQQAIYLDVNYGFSFHY